MYCKSCGKELSGKEAYCPNCGAQVNSPGSPLPVEISPKSRLAVTLLAYFVGVLGVHRFYLGKIWTGIAMLFTGGGLFVWAFVDFIMAAIGVMKDKDGKLIKKWDT